MCALEQLEKLATLDERIAISISCLVGTHQSRLVIEVGAVHSSADLTIYNSLVDLSKRQATVAIDVNLAKELAAGRLVGLQIISWFS